METENYMLDRKLINYLWLYQKVNVVLMVFIVLLILASFSPLVRPQITWNDYVKLYGDFLLFVVVFFNILAYQVLKRVEVSYRIRLRYSLITITSTIIVLALATYFTRVLCLDADFGYIDTFMVVNAAFGVFYWKMLFERAEKYNPGKASDAHKPAEQWPTEYRVIIVLVVVTCYATINLILAIAGADRINRARVTHASVQIDVFNTAVNDFKTDCGRYPSESEGLQVLLVNGGIAGWQGPYLPAVQTVPPDPWGNEYRYEVKGNLFLIRSAGPDGKFGSGDDIFATSAAEEED